METLSTKWERQICIWLYWLLEKHLNNSIKINVMSWGPGSSGKAPA
jgi:hypothetical protein